MKKVLAILVVLSVSGCSSNNHGVIIKNSKPRAEKNISEVSDNLQVQENQYAKKTSNEPSLGRYTTQRQQEKLEQQDRAASYQSMTRAQKAKGYGGTLPSLPSASPRSPL